MKLFMVIIRIFVVAGFFYLPFTFNYWKNQGHGYALREHYKTVDLSEISDQQMKSISDYYKTDGIECATLMTCGFNIPFLLCLLLATYIAIPINKRLNIRQLLFLYFLCVIIAVSCLTFGFPYHNRLLQDPCVSFCVSILWWLILGGVPLLIALIIRFFMKKKYNNSNK